MKRKLAIVLAGGLLVAGVSAASATSLSHPTKALRPAQVQNINGEKIAGAPNGMLAELLESYQSA